MLIGAGYLLLTMLVGRWERASGRLGFDGQVLDAPAGRRWWQNYAPYAACYLYFALLLVLEYGVFSVWRWALLEFSVRVTSAGRGGAFVYGVGLIVLVMALLLVALGAEPYLRAGVERRRLLRRFNKLAAGCIVGGVLGFVLSLILGAQH